MRIREPVVAGRFYAAEPSRCRAELERMLGRESMSAGVPDRPVGGLVPHAGWAFSGTVAAEVFRALSASTPVNTLILFGGVHHYRGRQAALFGAGRWETPLGPVEVDGRLAERILGHTNLIVDDPYAHEEEHSLEVQMPFVKYLFPEAKVVPVMVPPVKTAAEVGEALARTLSAYRYDALVIGTTDLTHYGPHYGFTPKGIGLEANRWAKEENDRHFIGMLCDMQSGGLVEEAARRKNACSSGAAAATVAACASLGAKEGILLAHATSSEVAAQMYGESAEDSVGYAGIVFV